MNHGPKVNACIIFPGHWAWLQCFHLKFVKLDISATPLFLFTSWDMISKLLEKSKK